MQVLACDLASAQSLPGWRLFTKCQWGLGRDAGVQNMSGGGSSLSGLQPVRPHHGEGGAGVMTQSFSVLFLLVHGHLAPG